MTLFHEIQRLVASKQIPEEWKPRDLVPHLIDHYKATTLNAFPYNSSISADGSIQGDFVKRGQKPKFYRLPGGYFKLIDKADVDSFEQKRNVGDVYEARPRIYFRRSFVEDIVHKFENREHFLKCADWCKNNYRPLSPSSVLYRNIIEWHKHRPLRELLEADFFFDLIYTTLIEWNMNSRAAVLSDLNDFKSSIRKYKPELVELSEYCIEEVQDDELDIISSILMDMHEDMSVMKSKTQLVGFSKTMHFLLPRLIMPIDGKFTLSFFYGYRPNFQTFEQEFIAFKNIFMKFKNIIEEFQLKPADLDESGWNTTIPKLIDNAIIGYISMT